MHYSLMGKMRLPFIRDVIFPRLGSNLAISVNCVNSWRKFKGGLGPANLENDIV